MTSPFFWIAALVAAILGCWVWRLSARWKRLELLLQRWSAEPPTAAPDPVEATLGEAARWLRKLQKRQESVAREASDARFNLRAILASLEDGVLVADGEYRITFANPALLQLFSLKGEPVGQSVLSTLRLPILQTMLEGVLEEGAAQQAEVERVAVGREEAGQLLVAAAPLRDASDRPRAVMVFRDVSRLRRLEEMRREFVANVSHELRTPLSIFHGHLENLIDTPNPDAEELQGSLQVMRRHALRLNALVEDLLTLARLESNRDPLVPEPVDLVAFLRETRQDWQPKASAKNIRIDLLVPDQLPEVSVDPLKFQQVLGNLLDNGVKYTPAGGVVTLRTATTEDESGRWLELGIEDNGTGIAREDLPHIFQRFYRADKARSREMGGTGLGLAIVKHIIQAHGGSVRAESELGKGTRIILRLPIS